MSNVFSIAFCVLQMFFPNAGGFDWLIEPEKSHSFISTGDDGSQLTIGNGMMSRTRRFVSRG